MEMAFSQLHYTSCENGLANYSGFQFCALTPGVSADVMREVERLTVYELPAGGAEVQDQAPDELPVNLMYTFSDNLGVAIVAKVKYAGRDFSNRPGNYFAHSLVTRDPERDLQPILPVELWDAPFWASSQVSSHELSALAGPLRRGPVTRQLIDEFLAAEPGRIVYLEALLTAADRALCADRRVLLVGADSSIVCRWIAAVSYLLGPGLGSKLTFSTYSNDPRRCLTHVVGSAVTQRMLRSGTDQAGFWVFDLASSELPDVPSCPAAKLLTRQGAVAAANLWSLATRLGASREEPLDNSFPLLASALLILGHRLIAGELAAAIEWLSVGRSEAAAGQIEVAVNAALKQRLEDIPAKQREQLVELALRVENGTCGALTERVECVIVQGSLNRVDNDEIPGAGFTLRTGSARKAASIGCMQRLPGDDAGRAVQLLRWAHEVGAEPGEEVLRQTGRDVLFAELQKDPVPPPLFAVAQAWPALRVGIIDKLASQPVMLQEKLLASSSVAIFRIDDFTEWPTLGEEWVISAASHRRMSRSAALGEITRLRRSHSGGQAVIDVRLLSRIWGRRNWTVAEGIELLSGLPAEELSAESVRSCLAALLKGMPDPEGGLREWMDFVTMLAPLSERILLEEDAAVAVEMASAIRPIRVATLGHEPADAAIHDLLERYWEGSPYLRSMLDRYLPPLLIRRRNLSSVLRDCPPALFIQFCGYAGESLARGRLDTRTIAELFVAMYQLEFLRLEYARLLEDRVFLPVLPYWTRREIANLGAEMNGISRNSSSHLDLWYRQHSRRRRLPWRGRSGKRR